MIQIFKNLFSSSNQQALKDLSGIGVDMHSHLVPGIDDGSKSAEDSVEMIKALMQLGYSRFITTPHVMEDYYKNEPETIRAALEPVKSLLKKENINVKIDAAAEYYMDPNLEKQFNNRNLMTFGNNYVLFELSYINEPMEIKQLLFNMKIAGYNPILAHPERYTYFYQNFNKYQDLFDFEILFQLNLGSLLGAYSPMAKRIAERLIDSGMISFVGTDTHNISHVRTFEKVLENKHLAKLIESGKLINPSLA